MPKTSDELEALASSLLNKEVSSNPIKLYQPKRKYTDPAIEEQDKQKHDDWMRELFE